MSEQTYAGNRKLSTITDRSGECLKGFRGNPVQIPFSRAIMLMDLYAKIREPMGKLPAERTVEEVSEFIENLTVERLNAIYAFEGNGLQCTVKPGTAFELAPFK